QVGLVDLVEVHQADGAHAGGGEVQRQRRAQPAGAHAEHLGRLEALLPLDADLRHDEVAAVAPDLLVVELRRLHRAPPAMAGTIDTTSPSFTGVTAPLA